MKLIRPLITICVVLVSTSGCFGQEKYSQGFRLADIYFLAGGGPIWSDVGTINDFKLLSPNSEILNQDLTDFDVNGNFGSTSATLIAAGVGFYLPKKSESPANKMRAVLRIDLTYRYMDVLSFGITRSDQTTIDSLVSFETGETFYVDSISTVTISGDLWTNVVYLGASVLFYTNPEARWSFFAGIGFGAGFGFHTASNNALFERSSRSPFYQKRDDENSFGVTTEQFEQGSGFASEIYLPFGVDFKLGDHKVWNRMHIAYQMRPAVSVTSIDALDTFIQPGLSHGVMMRYTW